MSEDTSNSSMPMDIRIGAMHHNLNEITKFHNHVHGFFNTNLANSQVADDLSLSDKTWLKREYDTHMPNQLRKSVFLMMFGHLEEHLFLGWCDHGSVEDEKDDRKDGVKKFKNLFHNIGIDVSKDSDYQFIVDAYKVRNSFIHTAGRIDITKKTGELERLVKNHSNFFEIKNKRVYLTSEGIFHFRRAIEAFSELVTRAAKR